MNNNAALYLRSSKDAHNVSISSQRRELQALASSKNLLIVKEFIDVVESAKDENRPGFQSLILELKHKDRQWDHLLMVDTSRLSRRRFMAQVFKHEAKKQNVTILYSKLPDMDPITGVIVESVLEAFDEVHSLMSREKGIAGMRENVCQGYRAGGRAPIGYQLKKVTTGAIREGQPVTKTVLELSPKSKAIKRYLESRIAGKTRLTAGAGLNLPASSLNGIEWNALTYAGHTVWNMHNEYQQGGYKGGIKRRPRSEWVMQENTHEPLITTEQAEHLIAMLEKGRSGKRMTGGKYLLTGLLKTPDGNSWFGDAGKSYRTRPDEGKGRYVPRDEIEKAVIGQIKNDWSSTKFASDVLESTRKHVNDDPAKDIRKQIEIINDQISKTLDLAVQLDNIGPVTRKINELELKRESLVKEMDAIQREYMSAQAAKNISIETVKALLKNYADDLLTTDRDRLKDKLHEMIEKITLDPETLQACIYYRIAVDARNKLASPRESREIPVLRSRSVVKSSAFAG